MIMNNLLDSTKREDRRFGRWVGRICRGPVGRSVALLGAVGFVLGIVLLVGPALAATFPDVYSDTWGNPDYPDGVSVADGAKMTP